MESFNDYINKKQKEVLNNCSENMQTKYLINKYFKIISESSKIIDMLEKYPDLNEKYSEKLYQSSVILCSKKVNALDNGNIIFVSTDYSNQSQSVITAYMFINDGDKVVYTEPPCVTIGIQDRYFGFIEDKYLSEYINNMNLNKCFTDKINEKIKQLGCKQ